MTLSERFAEARAKVLALSQPPEVEAREPRPPHGYEVTGTYPRNIEQPGLVAATNGSPAAQMHLLQAPIGGQPTPYRGDPSLVATPSMIAPGVAAPGMSAPVMSAPGPVASTGFSPGSPATEANAAVTRAGSQSHLDLLAQQVRADVVASLGSDLTENRLSDEELQRRAFEAINSALLLRGPGLTPQEMDEVGLTVLHDTVGLGPLEKLLADADITEIMVNGATTVYVERDGKIQRHPGGFRDEQHLRRTIDRIVARVGRRVDESSPMVDARLADGSRVHAAIPPAAIDGSTLTVRKFRRDTLNMDQLVSLGSITPDAAAFLACCVQGKLNVVVSGGTGTGKTTLLASLSAFIPEGERLITIEDAAELQLAHPHLVRLESRPPGTSGAGEITIRDLLRNALRMRPDRIIVGEVRDAAALDMLQAMSTGHNGSLGTVHASSARDALRRIETMVLFAGLDLPLRAVRDQIAAGIDVIVHLERRPSGGRKVVEIAEVSNLEGEVVTLQPIFSLRASNDALVPSGFEPGFWPRIAAHAAAMGVTLREGHTDEHRR